MKTTAPLSRTQYGIYAACIGHEGEIFYNTPYLYELSSSLDASRLCRAVEAAVAAHPTLFTRLEFTDDGEPQQTIDLANEQWTLEIEDVADIEPVKQSLMQPFELMGGRLFHIRLLRTPGNFYLLLDIHHIIADFTSQKVLLTDIETAYNGGALAPEQFTLAQLAEQEAELRKTDALERGRQWYAQNFDCADTFTPLMPDKGEETHEEHYTLTLKTDAQRVDTFCKQNGVFRSNFFTAAYALLLARFNNEQEALFTTIYNGRTNKLFAHSVGMSVKTLPVYGKFDDSTTVLDFFAALQEQMSGCRKHDVYSFSDLHEDLELNANTMFAWHGMLFSDEQFAGLPMRNERLCNSTLDCDIYLKAFILNGHYCVKAEYDGGKFSEALVRSFLESYEAVVEGMLSETLLRDINITTPVQLESLEGFNATTVERDTAATVVSLFESRAAAAPDAPAVVYDSKAYTYGEVESLSRRLAAAIAAKGLGEGDVVSILIPRCEWMPIASLGVLRAGCAYQPLDPTYPKERLNFMMKDASSRLLIADEALLGLVDEYEGDTLLTSAIEALPQAEAPRLKITPDNLFVLLYTSGSTGVPKGCRLVHRNIAAFSQWYARHYKLDAECRVAAYASYGFDACLMDMYPALTAGAQVHIIPEELRLDLMALNEYFDKCAITHAFMTTQVGYQFATSIENHSLRYLLAGGEKLATLTPPVGYEFHNIYGPTECCVCVTTCHVDREMHDIPIGKALDNMRLYVVDRFGRRQPVGASGELVAAGAQVSDGYLNRPEKTAEVFVDNPFSDAPDYRRAYRTGDIVRYLPDGNLQFVGRRDGQVKIRGFRIELKEVESVVRQFPGIKDATVQAFDADGGGKFIAAYVVADEPVDIEALNAFILNEKPPYMVPAVTMQIEAIPLTQNHKVNRRALPKPERQAASQPVAENVPMNVLEQQLHDMVAAIVGNTDFGVTTTLGFAGLTSISAIKLAVQVNKRYGVALEPRELVKTGTVQSIENEILGALLSGGTNGGSTAAATAEKVQRNEAPLSYAQAGVYFECLKNPASTIYNVPYLLTYPAGVDAKRLAEAVGKAVAAHPELHVRFETRGDKILQVLADEKPEVETSVMTDDELAEYKRSFVRPFNLQKAPLCRFEVVTTPKAVHLLIDLHHLIFDGGSADLLIRQISSALEGQAVEPEQYNYLDFAVDQANAEDSDEFKQARDFFHSKLKDCEGASEIPADLKPAESQTGFIGEAVAPADHQRIAQFCRQRGITPAHLFFAATAYVVARYTNSRDTYLSTISSGRSNLRVADTVGMFVNTLALPLSIADVTVDEYLAQASQAFDQTLKHENYPFARVAADYAFRPAVAFAYQVGVLAKYTVDGKPIERELLELNVPKFKINIKIEDRGVLVQYDDALYLPSTASNLAESISAVASALTQLPAGSRVRAMSIMSPAQREAVLRHRTSCEPADAPFSVFFKAIEHNAVQMPDKDAIIAVDESFTYRTANEAMNRIAHSLIERGVKLGDRVALLLPRTSRLMLSMFGVEKAGAAFIPCDPKYPAERIKLILEDSEARYVITTQEHLSDFPEGKALNVEDLLKNADTSNPDAGVTPDDLCYLIYTSGSTGRPKGVMLRHEGYCNYAWGGHPANVMQHAVAQVEVVLAVTTCSFDASMHEMAMPLYNGCTVVLASEEQTTNPLELARLITEHNVDFVSTTPSQWVTWISAEQFCQAIKQVKVLRSGGEKLPLSTLSQLQKITKAQIFNSYGPTETTVSSNIKNVTTSKVVTVGRPLVNVREFVVDADGNELPEGVVGELYIGGRGVGRGYNNLPDRTRESYITYQGERVYRSGDYAKWLPDGDVMILGRTDNQIKLRGLRIELGEIENVMMKVAGMQRVAIVIRKIGGKEHLCAFFTADRQLDIEQLKAEIGQSLTQYMVPTAYKQLDAMPMTPNGKTDLKSLPEPEVASAGEYVEPASDTERTFCDIFAGILQMERVGATDNFFELGGTSLVVTRVIIEADKAGLHVAYGDVFANPTPRKLARLVTGEGIDDTADEVASFDYTPIKRVLEAGNLEAFRNGKRQQLGRILLTGATGYLGIHILKELIDSDATTIYCLVRGKSLEDAESRLKVLLFYYFESDYDKLFGSRLRVVLGDVTQDIDNKLEVDTVFNCAAVVKHFSEGTEIEDVNIGGAARCVDYCLSHSARLVHISTASTRGISVNGKPAPDEVFTEHRLYMGQYLGNKYIYSKFMAERLILDAVARRGLSAKIMRVGNLAARSTDGEFQANFITNSFMGRIKVYNMLGCCPYSMRNKAVEFSPINEVSRAIVLLSSTPRECCVFHPYNNHTQFLGDVLQGLSSVGDGVKFVEQEEFQSAMDEAKSDPAKAKSLASLLAYQDMAHGQKTADVKRDNDFTIQVLYRLGYAWSPTSWDYVERMLTAIGGLGFFD